MARHPTARRKPRQPEPDDIFIERVLESAVWARENSRKLIAGTLLLALIAGGVLYYRYYTRTTHASAATQLIDLRATADAGNPALTIREGEVFLDRFASTPSAGEARLILGEAYLQSEQFQQAIDVLQPAARNLADPLAVSAALLTAAAYEALQRSADAEAEYLRVVDRAPHLFQKQRALESVARLRLDTGNPGGAVQIYDRLLRLVAEDSPERPVYQMRRAEALAAAGA